MANLGFTQQDLANLKSALTSGALKVKVGDREIQYRTQQEIIEAIKMAQAELNPPATPASSVIQATFSKGSK